MTKNAGIRALDDDVYDGDRSRVLFLSHDMLWPRIGGGRVRIGELLDRALKQIRIDLVVVAPELDVNRDSPAITGADGLDVYILADESTGVVPERTSPAAVALIRRLASRGDGYDAVHLEGHYLLPLVPPELLRRTVVVEQNIESQLLRQRRDLGEPIGVGEIARYQAREQEAWLRAAAVVTLSPEDTDDVRTREPGVQPHFIPNGWDHLPAPSAIRRETAELDRPRLTFVGDYDYAPNRDAFAWLVQEVFPRIRARIPGAQLQLAGINLSPELARMGRECEGAQVRGFVSDLMDELDRADIILCPLRVGGGMKVKVMEALRRSALLVATSVGAQGIPAKLRSAVCVADDAAGFAGHVVRLCANPAERDEKRQHLLLHRDIAPTWDDSSRRLLRLWSKVSRQADLLASGPASG